jgi:hypothetical protein
MTPRFRTDEDEVTEAEPTTSFSLADFRLLREDNQSVTFRVVQLNEVVGHPQLYLADAGGKLGESSQLICRFRIRVAIFLTFNSIIN